MEGLDDDDDGGGGGGDDNDDAQILLYCVVLPSHCMQILDSTLIGHGFFLNPFQFIV
jgi:hypothetical protein